MVIGQINISGVAAFHPEDNPPVGANRDRPEIFQIALKRMQSKSRKVHLVRRGRPVQNKKNILHPVYKIGTDTFAIPVLEKAFQSLMPETLYHNQMCNT